MGFFDKIKDVFTEGEEPQENQEGEGDYVELEHDPKEAKSKITVRPFVLSEFEDVKHVLDSLREGYTVALVNIRPLKDKDLVELKRAINKLKKTCDAVEGEMAGFDEDWLVVTPAFATIYRTKQTSEMLEE